jgi:hypothetical protein
VPLYYVTLVPRRRSFERPGTKATREKIEQAVVSQYGGRWIVNGPGPERIQMDVPGETDMWRTKTSVTATLDAIDPDWEQLYSLYPIEGM